VLGEKQGLGKELLEKFRVAGLSHIVVLSGFNVTILAYASGTMLYGSLYRGIRTISIGSVLITFALFVGLGSTVVRTVIMALVWAGAEFFYRRPRSIRVIAVSALSMIVYEPLIALYDPSFHLSFLALIGVVYLSPHIHKLFKKLIKLKGSTLFERVLKSLFETLATTFSAFIITAPYIWIMMGDVTWWGLLTNIVAIPVIPIVMLLTALVVPITSLSHAGGIVMAYPLSLILSWILYVVHIPEFMALK
jgi:competence protein ComEC